MAHLVYRITASFPKEEIYVSVSQLRRAALSVVLNYVEGYARQGDKVYRNFLKISYGSLKEVDYLLDFAKEEEFISDGDKYKEAKELTDRIGAMLWSIIQKL